MSKMISENTSSAIEIPDPNNLDVDDDDSEVFEGSELDSSAVETPATGGDDFMHTDDFRRLFVGFVMVDTLVAMRWLDKKWHNVVEKKLTELGDDVYVHGGKNINPFVAWSDRRKKRMKKVTKVVFPLNIEKFRYLLNITKVGDFGCTFATNLVVVDLPEGITSIGYASFDTCSSLKVIKFPKSLTYIGTASFSSCSSLRKVDLMHTNIQEFGNSAFSFCTNLREMKVPDSLQRFGYDVFKRCPNLDLSKINVTYDKEVRSEYLFFTAYKIALLGSFFVWVVLFIRSLFEEELLDPPDLLDPLESLDPPVDPALLRRRPIEMEEL